MNHFSKVFLAIALVIAFLAIPAAVSAENVRPGSHYSGIEVWQENRTAYGLPPLEQNEIDSLTTGMLIINLRTMGCAVDVAREGSIAPYDDNPVIPFKVGVDGKFDIRLPATKEGTKYEVVLPYGHGSDTNQPNTAKQETQTVTLYPGSKVYVPFIGAGGACGGEEPVATCAITITRAQYGDIDCHTEEVCEDVSNEVTQWLYFSHGTWHVRCNNPAHSGTHHLQFTCNHGTHEACHDEEVCTGSRIDVTANVREAVNKGYSSFVFRNDLNPGGIFGLGGGLLSAISDPAPGQVKTVTISYNKCGTEKTVTAGEYETISL